MTFSLTSNKTIAFGMGEKSEAALLQGWASPESGLVWSEGPQAVLRFGLSRIQPGSAFVIQASPHLTEGLKAQRVVVYGNGLYAGSTLLGESGEMTINVPSFVCMSVIASGLLDLAFDIADCRAGAGADRRLLGFALHGLTLRHA